MLSRQALRSCRLVSSKPATLPQSAHVRFSTYGRYASAPTRSVTSVRAPRSVPSQPIRSYQWSKFFESNKEIEPESWDVTPNERQRIVEMLNETDLELSAELEPLWGAQRPETNLSASLKGQIDQWEYFIRNTPEVVPLNFDEYRARVDPKLVDAIEAEFKAIEINSKVTDYKPSFEAHFQQLQKRYNLTQEQIGALDRDLDVQIDKLKALKARIPTVTLQDIINERPDLKEEALKEIEQDGLPVHSLSRYKGDEQYEAQYKAQEAHAEAHDHHH